MTIEEAIQDIKESIKPVVGGTSLDMAIEALERQIPKKMNWDDGCPNCQRLPDHYYDYCPYCGQKLD